MRVGMALGGRCLGGVGGRRCRGYIRWGNQAEMGAGDGGVF